MEVTAYLPPHSLIPTPVAVHNLDDTLLLQPVPANRPLPIAERHLDQSPLIAPGPILFCSVLRKRTVFVGGSDQAVFNDE